MDGHAPYTREMRMPMSSIRVSNAAARAHQPNNRSTKVPDMGLVRRGGVFLDTLSTSFNEELDDDTGSVVDTSDALVRYLETTIT